jgi:hypothetical protein
MPTYHQLCYHIWQLHEQYPTLPDGVTPRHFLFPPPWRGRAPDLLFVGSAPNQQSPIGWNGEYDHNVNFAREFEYIAGGPKNAIDLRDNGRYEPLLRVARLVDDRCVVWWQAGDVPGSLLVEFTEAMPLAALPEGGDLVDLSLAEELQEQCLQGLVGQLEYFQPRMVVAHGDLACNALHRLVTGLPPDEKLAGKTLFHEELRRAIHFVRTLILPGMGASELATVVLGIRNAANRAGVLA